MEEKILKNTKILKEKLSQQIVSKKVIDECKKILEEIEIEVKKLNNENVSKKYEGIFNDFYGKETRSIDMVINDIYNFEESLKINLEQEKVFEKADKLNSEYNKKYQIYSAIENMKAAITLNDGLTFLENNSIIEDYKKTLSKIDREKIVDLEKDIVEFIKSTDKTISEMTVDEKNKIIKKFEVLEKTIDEIKEKNKNAESIEEENYEEKPIPESKEEIKKEMDEILGDSIFLGIEKFDFELKGLELDNDTKEQIKTLQNECELLKLSNNDKKIEELREEIYLLAYPKFWPFKFINTDKIAKLSDNKHKRISILLSSYDEFVKKEKEERAKKKAEGKVDGSEKADIINAIKNLKESINLGKNTLILSHIRALNYAINQIEDTELREKMLKKLDSVEKRINGTGKITEGTKEQTIKELEELEELYKNKVVEKDPHNTPKTPVTPVENTKTKKKKGKKVVAAKSAETFYKRHKKGLLIAFGITLLAVSLPHLLPSIMYLHSALWGVAVASGVPANVGLPVILHDLNTIIGAKIGASYAASSGIWTLANGAALNATAAEAGILSVLGRLTTIALPFAGAKIAIKNAIKAAKDKIAKRKEKIEKEHPERKGHFFKNIKDYAKNKFNAIKENVTTKYTEAKENITSKYIEIKESHEKKKEEKTLEKERKRDERELELARYIKNPYLSRKTNGIIQMLYDNEIIEQDLFDELKEVEDETEAYEMIKKALKEEKGKGSK